MNRQEQYQNALVDTNKEFFITLIEGIILSTVIWMIGKNEMKICESCLFCNDSIWLQTDKLLII